MVTLKTQQNLSRHFFIFLGINALFALGNSSNAFIILRTKDLGFSLSLTILLYTLFRASDSLSSLPAGIISDRIGPRRVIIFGFLLFSFVYLMLGLSQASNFLWVLFPLYGFYRGVTDGVSKAYISNIVPQELLGTAYGFFQITIGIGNLLASLLAGVLWKTYGSGVPFILGSAIALITSFFLLIVDYINKKQTSLFLK